VTLAALFAGAPRVSHAALARFLRLRGSTLQAEGDRGAIAFQLTPTGRRLYTRAAVEAFLARADAPPAQEPAKPAQPPPRLRRRSRGARTADVVDFQAEVAAARARMSPRP
jgi:hypothetical protein